MNCREWEQAIALLACEELEGGEREALEAHLEECAGCRAVLERERELLGTVVSAGRVEPSAVLLASCRNELNDALDVMSEEKSAWRRLVDAARPSRWFALHPAWGAALCMVVGITLGNAVPQWLASPVPANIPPGADMVVQAASSDPPNFVLNNITWAPGADPDSLNVELTGRSMEPQIIRGSVSDPNVKQVLAYVVQNGQRYDSGQRLDAVELLKTQSNDAHVRKALCFAARQDGNVAVRLKALEALRDMGEDENVRHMLVDALLNDQNPGVRVVAVNALRDFAETAGPERAADFPHLVEVLRDRMQHDPSTYVRLQSAAAVRQLGPRVAY